MKMTEDVVVPETLAELFIKIKEAVEVQVHSQTPPPEPPGEKAITAMALFRLIRVVLRGPTETPTGEIWSENDEEFITKLQWVIPTS
jgi:hypothetical protein